MSKEKSGNWFGRHKILSVILALVLVGIIASASGGNKTNSSNTSNTSSSSKSTKKAEIAKIGTPARDGKFEFTVKNFECGKAKIGTNEYLTKKAQGQYCLLNVTVKNIGNEKQSLLSSDQKLFKGNVEYSADDTATLYAAPDGSSWYNDINPGNSVEGTIVFDIPKDVTPTLAELHDSSFSNGVKVSLQ